MPGPGAALSIQVPQSILVVVIVLLLERLTDRLHHLDRVAVRIHQPGYVIAADGAEDILVVVLNRGALPGSFQTVMPCARSLSMVMSQVFGLQG